ncbi:hypothetical protein AL01_08595 [Bombella intestini]|uniref:Uncharacterized protein n=1 Tax=Bombella intestini TaxID=1539051 RepID=A0A1S8GNE4_9PROT|nr:tetratricopeptide repeat protein [Bombella intestini]OOL17374.1 hypothetical protein AL01_08595 [Bombella intestini]
MSMAPLHRSVCNALQRTASFERLKPPALWLGAFFMVLISIAPRVTAASPAHEQAKNHVTPHATSTPPHDKPAATPPKPHSLSLQEKLEQTEQAIASEQDDQKAQSLMKKADTLRLYSVKNSGRILLNEAQDNLKQGHITEAEKTLSAALTLQPDNAFLRRQRAAIRFLGNDLTGAVQDLQVALVHDPGDAQSWDILAHTQEHLHHPHQALHAYTEALTHAPLLPNGQKRYRQLEQQANGTPD